jgi:tRNA-Thr(GGU) m(6)t(6)A37 methyltransferase TsaA
MRFMMLVKGNTDYEAGKPPSPALAEAIGTASVEQAAAGVLLTAGGLLPSAAGALVRVERGKVKVVDGPFAEGKELIGGFAILKAESKQEAIEMGRAFMQLHVDVLGPSFSGELEIRQMHDQPEAPTLRLIGRVESALTDPGLAPKQGEEGAPDAWLVFDESVRDALADLREGDEVILLTWLDRADRSVLRVHPRDDLSRPLRGVFATRSADRPNPIGLHRVRIRSIAGATRLRVGPLEAVDGTPIVDVKPVL